jgi:hypothetical protein
VCCGLSRASGRGGRGDDDAAGEADEREVVAGLVLQVGERGVVAGVANVESDLVDAGPEGGEAAAVLTAGR